MESDRKEKWDKSRVFFKKWKKTREFYSIFRINSRIVKFVRKFIVWGKEKFEEKKTEETKRSCISIVNR